MGSPSSWLEPGPVQAVAQDRGPEAWVAPAVSTVYRGTCSETEQEGVSEETGGVSPGHELRDAQVEGDGTANTGDSQGAEADRGRQRPWVLVPSSGLH